MRIGINVDNTICDTFEFVLPYCCKYYSISYEEAKEKQYSYEYFIENYGYYDFAKKYYDKIIPYVPIKKNIAKVLNKLQKRGHEIIFITSRSKKIYSNPYQLTYDYLIKNNIPFDALITEAEEKETICLDEEINIYIDDNINDCISVKNNNIKVLLIDTLYNKDSKDLKRIKNFKQLYRLIKKEEKDGRRKSNN